MIFRFIILSLLLSGLIIKDEKSCEEQENIEKENITKRKDMINSFKRLNKEEFEQILE